MTESKSPSKSKSKSSQLLIDFDNDFDFDRILLNLKTSELKVNNHPFFGSHSVSNDSVDDVIEKLRYGRYQ